MQNNQKSIHIVIFTGGLYPSPEKTASYWKNPLHGNPDFVIAADSGLEACLEYNRYFEGLYDFLPGKILGDFDSISDKFLLKEYADVTETFPADKDFTDTELAVHRAYQFAESCQKTPFITLVGGDGGRNDHFLNIFDGFRTEIHPDVWLCQNQQLVYLLKHSLYELCNLKKEDSVSFCNVFGKGKKIITEGLQWESGLFRAGYMPSVSNRISDRNLIEGKPVMIKPKAMGFVVIGPLSMAVLVKSQ